MEISKVIGDEYDGALWDRLTAALKQMGAVCVNNDWALAGSQEIDRFCVELDGQYLTIESETYTGITLTGPYYLIAQIEAELNNSHSAGTIIKN